MALGGDEILPDLYFGFPWEAGERVEAVEAFENWLPWLVVDCEDVKNRKDASRMYE